MVPKTTNQETHKIDVAFKHKTIVKKQKKIIANEQKNHKKCKNQSLGIKWVYDL